MFYLKASVIEKQLKRHSRDIFMEFTDPWKALEAMYTVKTDWLF